MKYKKIATQTYNLHIIKTKKFKTVSVQVNFKNKLKKDEITYRNLLINLLCSSTEKYPNKRLMEIATEDLYELNYQATNYISGKYNVMAFDITFLNEKYTESGMFDQSIDFLCEILFHPLTEDTRNYTRFSTKSFEMAYRLLEDRIKSVKESPMAYSQMRMNEIMSPKTLSSLRPCGYMEDLEKINAQKLYSYYKDMIKSDIIDIFVIGDVNESHVRKVISNKFKVRTIKKRSESHFLNERRIHLLPKTVKEKQNINQSQLVMGFKIDNTTDFEKRYIMNVYSYILGGGPDSKLFKNVREKNSLCYSIHSVTYPLNNIMVVSAGINSSDFKQAVSLIKKEVKQMQKGNFKDEDIIKAKVTYMNSIKELEDNPQNLLGMYAGIEYLKSDDIDTRIKKINRVTKKSVMKFAQKIHLDTIYLLEGVEENEEM